MNTFMHWVSTEHLTQLKESNMFHESIKIKEAVIKEKPGFRLRVRSWKCVRPADLNSIEFIQEMLKDNGDVQDTSTYNFFMTDEEIKILCKNLVND